MTKELRILLLEDSPTDAELVLRELKREGLQFTHRPKPRANAAPCS